jgi:predicted glutamine amidotransferase
MAYRGETTALEHYVTEPAHSLITQSIQALESTTSINGDGFGLGWYGMHPEPGLYREIRPAWSDDKFRYLCRHLQSHLFFACAQRPARRSPGRTAIRSRARAGCSCTTGSSAAGTACAGQEAEE